MTPPFELPCLDGFEQPVWNKPESVASAFASALCSFDKASSQAAYHELLSAIGNNHAGTYYPVVLAIMPAFERILRDGSDWARRSVLEVITELATSFAPEPGLETFRNVPMVELLASEVRALIPVVKIILADAGVAAASAGELLTIIDGDSNPTR